MSEEEPGVYWFTLGRGHARHVNGRTWDHNTVIEIAGSFPEARQVMFDHFEDKWAAQYNAGSLDLDLFSGGVRQLDVSPTPNTEGS